MQDGNVLQYYQYKPYIYIWIEKNIKKEKQTMQGLSDKIKLRFGSNGAFKILAMSDIQEHCTYNPETFEAIEKLLDAQKPDLVLLVGDNCNGPKINTEDELREYVSIVARPIEERGIPWAQVWGNHDHDVRLDKRLHQSLYMEYPHNVSSTVPEISGQSNFLLPIYSSHSDDIVFNVWGLDSGPMAAEHSDGGISEELFKEALSIKTKVNPHQKCWGFICFDQLMWYYNTSKELEAKYGKKIPGLLATHVAPYEISAITDDPEQCDTVGEYPEHMSLGLFNSGLFATVIQRGDIKVICSGHSHDDTECGKYCGITLCNDGSVGLSCYGKREHKGARVFELCESDPDRVETYFVRAF